MKLTELIERLQELEAEGYGQSELFDYDANPIINAVVDDETGVDCGCCDKPEFRIYIEAEF